MTGRVVRIGTRSSALAMAQTEQVAAALRSNVSVDTELVSISTRGDIDRGPLAQIGGTGVFVTAVRTALLDGRVDLAVHSFKDLPTAEAPGITLAAVPAREDPADALCAAGGLKFAQLPEGARVGTGSPRRAAQLLRLRADLKIEAIRGNIGTRLGLVRDGVVDAVVLARAGLARLGRLDALTDVFDFDDMLPAPAQGALAVECRTADLNDADFAAAIALLNHRTARCTALAERSLLATLEAGCSSPVGAAATIGSDRLTLRAMALSLSGDAAVSGSVTGTPDQAVALGAQLADDLLRRGAADLLRPA